MDAMTKERRAHRRGTEIVEAAIVLPLLLMLVLGAIEYGWLFLKAQQITNAARQGARIAILPHATAESEANAAIATLLGNAGLADNSPDVTITPVMVDGHECVTVRITVSTTGLAIVNAPGLIPIPGTLGCAVTMAKEGGS
jgi:Flp pilus assembly protein TadG